MTYRVVSNHGKIPTEKQIMTYVSIDPGQNNFDIRIEKRIRSVVRHKCSSIRTLVQSKHIISYKDKKTFWVLQLHRLLDSYAEHYQDVDIVLIEKQMPINTRMKCMEAALQSYFMLKCPHSVIVEISPKLKGKVLAPGVAMTNAELKKWSPKIAAKLTEKRGDKAYFELTAERGKMDDDADTLVQLEAFCIYVGYADQSERADIDTNEIPLEISARSAHQIRVHIRKRMEILACGVSQSDSRDASLGVIPEEIEAEPFAHSDITPDVYNVSRSFFAFITREDSSAECVIGETSFRTAFSEAEATNVTYISVVTVYDSYGLEIACSYISRLRALSERQATAHDVPSARQVAIYLVGSLAILTPSRAQLLYNERDRYQSSDLVIMVCSALLEELLALDEAQPRLTAPLEPAQILIPEGLLALICNSKRISKGIAAHVIRQRCGRALRPGELEFRAIHPRTKVLSDLCWYIADSDSIWYLMRRPSGCGNVFLLSTVLRNESLLRLGRVVVHSPRYHARLRGVPEPEMMKTLLDSVDRADIDVVCGWVIQLMCELSERIMIGDVSQDISTTSSSSDDTSTSCESVSSSCSDSHRARSFSDDRLVIREGVCLTRDDLLRLFSVLVAEAHLTAASD